MIYTSLSQYAKYAFNVTPQKRAEGKKGFKCLKWKSSTFLNSNILP